MNFMHIFSVRTLTQAVKDVLKDEIAFVRLRRQMVSLSNPPSGNILFSSDNEVTG